jgi:hypothetical protein
MRFFFLAVFAIYGGMHAYAFHRIRMALMFGMPAGVFLAVFMFLMTLAPFLIHILEQREYELAARSLSNIAYFWMGLLFLSFCISLLLEASNVILRVAGFMRGSPLAIPPKPWFLAASSLALVICIYGYFSALDIKIERLTIETEKLPAGIDRLKIVQISDLHLGMIVRGKRLQNIVNAINAEKPDMLVSTGDLVDGQIDHLDGLAPMLRGVRAPSGKYAITGNHEFYAGLRQAVEFTESAGFTVLRDKAISEGAIIIAGVDDPAAIQLKIRKLLTEKALLSPLPRQKFTLLLKHRPSIDPETAPLFDLQLSGHTHKGQIFPFNYVVQKIYPLIGGTFLLQSGPTLHVSRGTGTWGPPIRFLSPPEITAIELLRKRG